MDKKPSLIIPKILISVISGIMLFFVVMMTIISMKFQNIFESLKIEELPIFGSGYGYLINFLIACVIIFLAKMAWPKQSVRPKFYLVYSFLFFFVVTPLAGVYIGVCVKSFFKPMHNLAQIKTDDRIIIKLNVPEKEYSVNESIPLKVLFRIRDGVTARDISFPSFNVRNHNDFNWEKFSVAKQYKQDFNGRLDSFVEFRNNIHPKKSGKLLLGPVMIKATVSENQGEDADENVAEDFISNVITISVL